MSKIEKQSAKFAEKLRVMFQLPKPKGNTNALLSLDGFIADLGCEGVDSAELVREARTRNSLEAEEEEQT